MADTYIKQSDAINDIFDQQITITNNLTEMDSIFNTGLRRAMSVLANLPAADVVPVRHGKWVDKSTIIDEKAEVITEWQSARCTCCNKYHTTPYLYYFDNFTYCPNCGARMDLDADGEVPETII